MTSDHRPIKSPRPEPLPTDWEESLRDVDAVLARQLSTEAPEGLVERLYEATREDLARQQTVIATSGTWRRDVRMLWRTSGLAAAVVIVAGTVVFLRPGPTPVQPPTSGTGTPNNTAARAASVNGDLILPEEPVIAFDARIDETSDAVVLLCQADAWEPVSVWERIDGILMEEATGW